MDVVNKIVGTGADNRVGTLDIEAVKVETKEAFYKMAIKNKHPKDIQAKAGI